MTTNGWKRVREEQKANRKGAGQVKGNTQRVHTSKKNEMHVERKKERGRETRSMNIQLKRAFKRSAFVYARISELPRNGLSHEKKKRKKSYFELQLSLYQWDDAEREKKSLEEMTVENEETKIEKEEG